MTPDQVRAFAMDAVLSHPPREVGVVTHADEYLAGVISFAGQNKFRLDTPLAACFFTYDEVDSVR